MNEITCPCCAGSVKKEHCLYDEHLGCVSYVMTCEECNEYVGNYYYGKITQAS